MVNVVEVFILKYDSFGSIRTVLSLFDKTNSKPKANSLQNAEIIIIKCVKIAEKTIPIRK